MKTRTKDGKTELPSVRISQLPRAVVIVTAKNKVDVSAAATISWVGVLSSRPVIVGVSFLPDSFTRSCILETREFVINVPTKEIVTETNFLGSITGPFTSKNEAMQTKINRHLTLMPSVLVKAPRIKECYLHIECRVLNQIQLGIYDCFFGEALSMSGNETLFKDDHPRGRFDSSQFSPIFCIGDEYWSSGQHLGKSTENKNHFHGPNH